MYGTTVIDKNYILERVSQQQIFEHYLGIPVEEGTFFKSPLRKDNNPTCSFKWVGNTLLFRDWAEARAKNCFDIVVHIYNVPFVRAVHIIKEDLIDSHSQRPDITKADRSDPHHGKKILQVKIAPRFQPEVIHYLQSFHLAAEQVKKFNMFPITKLWVEGSVVWNYAKSDPALAYYFGKSEQGEQRWKIYFFKRSTYRFVGNTNRINGWPQLPEKGKICIITKSMKDVACLDRFSIPAISMQNENTIPYDYIIEELKTRFDYLYSLYDFDRTGITNANKLKRMYNIPALFFTNGKYGTKNYGAKDFSDFLRDNGVITTRTLINNAYGNHAMANKA